MSSSCEHINPVTEPYMAISHGNPDLAEWNRYVTELKLKAATDQLGADVHNLMQKDRSPRGEKIVSAM